MNLCITIGCYRLPQFVELCIRRCRTVLGSDVPILLSDDRSDRSAEIEALAVKYDCSYLCPEARRSHFSGDIQGFISGLVFCQDTESDAVLKISQRFIPVLPSFGEALDRAFANPAVQVALPGKPAPNQIARPSARFYTKFGILTDAVAVRRGAISGSELLDVYRDRVCHPKAKHDSFVETTWGWLIANRFAGRHAIIPEWTNHEPFKPKIYLRKSQSSTLDYQKVAAMEGLTGDWDLREWGMIEQKHYVARPTRV